MFPETEAFSCRWRRVALLPRISSSPGPVEIATPASPDVCRAAEDCPTRRTLRGAPRLRTAGRAAPPEAPAGSGMRVGARDKAHVTHRICPVSSNGRHQYRPESKTKRTTSAAAPPDTAGRRVRRPPRRVLSRQRPEDRSCLARNGSPSKRCPPLPRTTTLISAVRGVVGGHRSGQYSGSSIPDTAVQRLSQEACSGSARARLACET